MTGHCAGDDSPRGKEPGERVLEGEERRLRVRRLMNERVLSGRFTVKDVEQRRSFIQRNARDVRFLDI